MLDIKYKLFSNEVYIFNKSSAPNNLLVWLYHSLILEILFYTDIHVYPNNQNNHVCWSY